MPQMQQMPMQMGGSKHMKKYKLSENLFNSNSDMKSDFFF